MCDTVGGKAVLFGKIRIRPNKFEPIVLPELRYIIFNEENDILKLNYRAVCIDMEVEARGNKIDETLKSLEQSVNHYIDLAIKDFGLQKAHAVLMEERRNKSESRKIAHISYGQAIDHRYSFISREENIAQYIKLIAWPYYLDLLRRLFFIIHRSSKFYTSRELAI